jgi:hypothetical protein
LYQVGLDNFHETVPDAVSADVDTSSLMIYGLITVA